MNTRIVTQKQAATIVRNFGLTFSVTAGEMRIAPKDGTRQQNRDAAYFTTDAGDAIHTAFDMASTPRWTQRRLA